MNQNEQISKNTKPKESQSTIKDSTKIVTKDMESLALDNRQNTKSDPSNTIISASNLQDIQCYLNLPWTQPKPCNIQSFTYCYWDGLDVHYYLKDQKTWWWYDYNKQKWLRNTFADMEHRLSKTLIETQAQGASEVANANSVENNYKIKNVKSEEKIVCITSTTEQNQNKDSKKDAGNQRGKVASFIQKFEVLNLKEPTVQSSVSVSRSGVQVEQQSFKTKQGIALFEGLSEKGKEVMKIYPDLGDKRLDKIKQTITSVCVDYQTKPMSTFKDASLGEKKKTKGILKWKKEGNVRLVKKQSADYGGSSGGGIPMDSDNNWSSAPPKEVRWNDNVKTYNYEPCDNLSPTPLLVKDVHPKLLETRGYSLEDYSRYYWESNCPQFVPTPPRPHQMMEQQISPYNPYGAGLSSRSQQQQQQQQYLQYDPRLAQSYPNYQDNNPYPQNQNPYQTHQTPYSSNNPINIRSHFGPTEQYFNTTYVAPVTNPSLNRPPSSCLSDGSSSKEKITKNERDKL